ncbi:hypothetical protein BDV24DRAFT_127578 [Aspergillus arachidicola]|uniref:Secreted protein n=1 Tax=Aspergillus arachidicola TaxID=656916 RepID=A0A5N6YFF6_9EURO|nr:hypothetical protein BDV24DRAFT_127578 [Aspergillus arachidicola]
MLAANLLHDVLFVLHTPLVVWPWSSRQSSRLAATPRHDTIRFPGGVRLQVSDSHVASSLPPPSSWA